MKALAFYGESDNHTFLADRLNAHPTGDSLCNNQHNALAGFRPANIDSDGTGRGSPLWHFGNPVRGIQQIIPSDLDA